MFLKSKNNLIDTLVIKNVFINEMILILQYSKLLKYYLLKILKYAL